MKREKWNSKLGFILAVVGSAIGLGNIWRYPYMLYSNGGGAFLIPYFVAIITAGIPLVILEYAIGHKHRGSAPLAYYRMGKKFEMVGWVPAITMFAIMVFYCAILSWAMNYLAYSFTLGWGDDTNAFFFKNFLQLADGPFSLGSLRMPSVVGIIAIWGINWFILYRGVAGGIEKFNRVVIPVLLTIIVIIVGYGISLPGAMVGLEKLFTPDWSKLADSAVWLDAYTQVFFSLSIAMGILIAYSSYLPKKTDLNNSALITAFANCGFEFFVSIGIFGILGYMAVSQGVPVEEVASGGIGLAFIVFPKVFNLMGGFGYILGFLFFSALILAGITSSASVLESFVSGILDKTHAKRKTVVSIASVAGCTVSLIFATGSGLYILDIMDHFINSYLLLGAGLFEAIIVGWFIGTHNMRKYSNKISLFHIGSWWDVVIKYVLPAVLSFVIITSTLKEFKAPYENYPVAALLIYGVGTVLAVLIASAFLTRKAWPKDDAPASTPSEVCTCTCAVHGASATQESV